jgi:cardiolipin synthase
MCPAFITITIFFFYFSWTVFMWIAILATFLLTSLFVIVLVNFKTPEKTVRHMVSHCHAIDDPQFELEMDAMLGPDMLQGNAITALQNGNQIFPAMLAAIRGAKSSITFETYIYWSGAIGREFADALIEKARAGVPVHVMLDWAGSAKMDASLLTQLTDAGIEVERYHPLRWYSLARMNNRTHRKLLVIDGCIGFTGGVGIADQWQGDAQDPDHWRDLHFKIEGPVVAQLQAGFMDNWIKATGTVLHSNIYYPPLAPVGPHKMHMFVSSPAGGTASMHLMYLLAVAAAVTSIDLQAAYFIPDALMVETLVAARVRGVRIRLLVPGRYIDSRLVRIASKRRWGRLLAAGVEIFEYQPTMMHNKMLILDRLMVSVGSTNFDIRSFNLNDEASLNVYSPEFGQQMTSVMEADLLHAKAYSLHRWQKRSFKERVGEWVVRPIESQL